MAVSESETYERMFIYNILVLIDVFSSTVLFQRQYATDNYFVVEVDD